MESLLSAAGRAFLRAFVAALVVFAAGILAAPNLNRLVVLGVAALVGAFNAGVRALQGAATAGEHPAPAVGISPPPPAPTPPA